MQKSGLKKFDIIGVSSASLCLVHCLFFPILTILPLSFSHNHWIDFVFLCVGWFVISKILLSNVAKKVKIILAVSIVLITTGIALEFFWEVESLLVIIGGIGMICGHILNYRLYRK
jgi:hypothetical protein